MKIAKVLPIFAIAIAMTAVLAISGCVEEAGDVAEDISEIGSKEYQITFIKGVNRSIAVDSEYVLLLRRVRSELAGLTVEKPEVVVEIFSNNMSIEQRTLKTGEEVRIKRLTLQLVEVDIREEYAEIKISEKIDVIGHGKKTGVFLRDVAEAIKSQS